MSLLSGAVQSASGNAFFASSTVNSQIYTVDYVGPTPFSTYLSPDLPVGTYQVTVQMILSAATSASTAATDVLGVLINTDSSTDQLYITDTIMAGFYSTTLNASVDNKFSVSVSGFVTVSNPTKRLSLSVQLLQGTGVYNIIPLNISYALVSNSYGTAG